MPGIIGGTTMDLNSLDVKGAIELAAVGTTAIGGVGSLLFAAGRGIGPRTIQLTGAIMVVPVVLILALEKTLEASAFGVVIGAVIGYLLSGVSETIVAAGPKDTA
jgi:hypothetical protein